MAKRKREVAPEVEANGKLDVMFSSEDDTWRTPAWLCGQVQRFYEHKNFLDPAAPEEEPYWTGATMAYTKKENGLEQPWRGRVYLNPPYGREVGAWVEKFIAEYQAGRMFEGLILLPVRTETKWWQHLIGQQPLLFFFYGRLTFEGADNSAPFPSSLAYVGPRAVAFSTAFQGQGWTARIVGL